MRFVAFAVLLAVTDVMPPPARTRPAPTANRRAAAAGQSWEEADSLARKIEEAERRRKEKAGSARRPLTVTFTDRELSSYLNLSYAEKLPKGLSNVDVRFERERVTAKGMLDLDRIKGKVRQDSWSPVSFMSGVVPVEATGKVSGKEGFGTVVWETVYVSSVRVPIAMLEQMVLSSTKNEEYPEGFDINAPFRLPYAARTLRVDRGRAVVNF